ncbi:LOW QUALITY PROTEIN: somatostatin receptor type 4 [Hipposideros larvatus]
MLCRAVLSVDHYIAMVHPLRTATYWRHNVTKLGNLDVWVATLLITLPIAIFTGTRPALGSQVMTCNLYWMHLAWSVVFVVYTFLLGFLPLVLAIGLCYLLMVSKMRVVALWASWQQRKHSEKIRRLVMVLAIFVLCMPFYVVQLLSLFVNSLDATTNLILRYANSCSNPILYGVLSDNFHSSFQQIFCLYCCLLDATVSAEEEPLDYSSVALKSRGNAGCICPSLPCQQEPMHQEPSCKQVPLSRTTTFGKALSPPTQHGHLQGGLHHPYSPADCLCWMFT